MIALHIQLNGITDEQLLRPFQHITNLFFTNAHVSLTEAIEPTIEITFHIYHQQENVYVVTGKVIHVDGRKRDSSYRKSFTTAMDKVAYKQALKYALLHVYVLILQDMTGITQKWGVLTGIRPTKLLHRNNQRGISQKETYEQLTADFLISHEKVELMQQIIDRQLTVIPDLYQLKNEVSIYIGIPFCPTKCAYCTFPAYAIHGRQGSVNAFLQGLHAEIEQIGNWLKENDVRITTIYFGGGTPTSLTADEMDKLYEKMYQAFPNVPSVREITVEAGRPDTITKQKLTILKKWNIDRISINPQSFIQSTLQAIGRHHTVEETIEKFYLAREMGMNNINMDLIIGLPGEGVQEFSYTLEETRKLMPESVTVHTLSFKKASEMTRNKQKYPVASHDEIEQMMSLASKWTKVNNYVPYYLYRQKNILGNLENVGYAQPNKESLYNIIIMEEQQTIIGIGCGAASKFVHPKTGKITRYANPKEPRVYENNYTTYIDGKLTMLKDLFQK